MRNQTSHINRLLNRYSISQFMQLFSTTSKLRKFLTTKLNPDINKPSFYPLLVAELFHRVSES